MKNFNKFITKYIEVYDSYFWEEIELSYIKQGYSSFSTEDVKLMFDLVYKLEKKRC